MTMEESREERKSSAMMRNKGGRGFYSKAL